MGPLGGAHAYTVVSLVWQVSTVIIVSESVPSAFATGILAAPQQFASEPQMVSVALLGLKVPFDKAFSHLAPTVPAAGMSAIASSMSPSMVSRLLALVAMASARVAAYSSNLASLHATTASR